MKRFIIYAPPYNENGGGTIAMHKLCSLLNELGYPAYLYLYFPEFRIQKFLRKNIVEPLIEEAKSAFKKINKTSALNKHFNTPIYDRRRHPSVNDCIVIYPETISGNPLSAKNIVRWLLYQPGLLQNEVRYGKNELYVKFNSAIRDFYVAGSTTSDQHLKVIHYPLEYYNDKDVSDFREGTAYCIRKGRGKTVAHDLTDSILIDGKSHAEVAKIFKKAKTFISYDPYTAYSIFAVLCGCESIVIPDDGISIDEWYPNIEDRYGISYGFNDFENARKTAHLVKMRVLDEEKKSIDNAKAFAEMAIKFFRE